MRDTGPLFQTLTGDTETAGGLKGFVRTQVGILKAQMLLGNLAVGQRTATMEDGTVVNVKVAGGMTRTQVFVPQAGSSQPEVTPETYPEVPEPQVQPPAIGGIVVGVPWASQLFQSFYGTTPADYNSDSITYSVYNEKKTSWYPLGGEANPAPAWQMLPTAGSTVYPDTPYVAISAQGQDGQSFLVNQPTAWQTEFLNGVVNAHASHVLASAVDTLYTLYRQVGFALPQESYGFIRMPYVLADTPMKIVGTGGDSSGSTSGGNKGASPTQGIILVKKNAYLAQWLWGRTGNPLPGATFGSSGASINLTINGIPIYVNSIGTGNGTYIDITDGFNIVFSYASGYDGNPLIARFNFPCAAILTGNSGSYAAQPTYLQPDQGLTGAWNPFRFVWSTTVPASNTQSGTSTFADAAGNVINVPCTVTVDVTSQVLTGGTLNTWSTFYTPDGPLTNV